MKFQAVIHLRDRTAFTLIELLVVIAVIGILLSIMLPSLGRARMTARQVSCLSNVRQITLSFVTYGNDAKDVLPPLSDTQPTGNPIPRAASGRHWYEYLGENEYIPAGESQFVESRGYITGAWRCAMVTDDQINPDGSYGWGGGYGVQSLRTFRYATYRNIYSQPKRRGGPKLYRYNGIKKLWLVGDTGRPDGYNGNWRTWVGTYTPDSNNTPLFEPDASGPNHNQPAARHPDGKVNVGFFDGHAESLEYQLLNVPINENRYFPTEQEANRL